MKKAYKNQKKQIEDSNKKIFELEKIFTNNKIINEELTKENKKLEEIINENEKNYNECINNKDNELKSKEDKINKKEEKLLELAKQLEDNKKEMNIYKTKYNEFISNSKNYDHDGIKCEKCFEETIIGYRYKCSVCNNYNICQKCQEKNENSEESFNDFTNNKKEYKENRNIINNDYMKDNTILINDINMNNKQKIYEKKEDKIDSSSNIFKKFLDEKSKIEKSYDKLINEIIYNYSNEKETYQLKLKEKENKIKLPQK